MVKQKTKFRNIELRIAYVGTRYAGWQVQPHCPTVQGTLQAALVRILGEPEVRTSGASRTDAGVHAHDQHVSFRTRSAIPCEGLKRALHHLLPPDIQVLAVRERESTFSARFDAQAKHYFYLIYNGHDASPFLAPYMWSHRKALDVALMAEAARLFEGTRCFKAFQAAPDVREETETTLFQTAVTRWGKLVCFDVIGSHFLYHMVRNMAGSLHMVGKGEWSLNDFAARFESGERTQMGSTAPAHGLHLFEVFYQTPYEFSPSRDLFLQKLAF